MTAPAGSWSLVFGPTGVVQGNGTGLAWQPSGSVPRCLIAGYSTPTADPFHTVVSTLSTPAGFRATGLQSNMLIGNAKADFSEFVYVQVFPGSATLGYYNAGVGNWGVLSNYVPFLSTATYGTWADGVWTLECGYTTIANEYRVALNGTAQLAWKDSLATIPMDSSHVYAGQAFFSDVTTPGTDASGNAVAAVEVAPRVVTKWQVGENPKLSVPAGNLRVFRLSNTPVTTLSNPNFTDLPVPPNFFDSVEYCSSDITWSAETSAATVSKTGVYLATMSISLPLTGSSAVLALASVYKNGEPYLCTAPVGVAMGFSGSFPVPLSAGDTVGPAIGCGDTPFAITGEGTGTLTYFCLNLLNS